MNQIYYIDNDEEITSIVDRLKKSKADKNFLVVPQRALVLQSLVNLKLLKREAEKERKQIIIVTQNSLGEIFAKKAGIETVPSIDGLEAGQAEPEDKKKFLSASGNKIIEKDKPYGGKLFKKNRLESIGSSEFFEGESKKTQEPILKIKDFIPAAAVKSGIASVGANFEKERKLPQTPRSSLMNDVFPALREKEADEFVLLPKKEEKDFTLEGKLSTKREEKLELLFQPGKTEESAKNSDAPSPPVSGKIKKVFILFSIVCVAAVAGVLVYLFLPRAEISVYPRLDVKEIDLDLTGDEKYTEIGDESGTFPLRFLEKENTLTESFDASGKNESSSNKARGKAVIFNEYSNSPQSLVATTRLLAENGKLFRLMKGVAVPGMTSVGNELKPGAIEAEIIADGSGEEYNIEPSRFSIPGFEGGPKYEKFYAKSEKMTSGGGSGSSSQIISVSQQDIENAKKKAEADIEKQTEEKLVKEISQGDVLLPEAISQTVKESVSLAKAGEIKNTFDYKVKTKSQAIIFQEDNIKKMAIKAFQQKFNEYSETVPANIQIEYRQITPDFQSHSLRIKVYGKLLILPDLDLSRLKKDLLGKDENQARDVLKEYPQVEGVEINFWPKFFPGRIPQYANQVKMKVTESTTIDKN